MNVSSKLSILLVLSAAAAAGVSLPASAAGPPPPVSPPLPPPPGVPLVPDIAQERVQAQLMIQQAQAQAQLAASQARAQAQLNANQARIEGQIAAQEAGTQAQLAAARQGMATAGRLAALSPPIAGLLQMQMPLQGPVGTMELIALTPQLGRYFGTDHGVLVVRAPTHGVLKLQDGDVILSIGGRVPASSSQAIRILTSYDPGEKIRLVILREHHRVDITAKLPPPALPEPPAGP